MWAEDSIRSCVFKICALCNGVKGLHWTGEVGSIATVSHRCAGNLCIMYCLLLKSLGAESSGDQRLAGTVRLVSQVSLCDL